MTIDTKELRRLAELAAAENELLVFSGGDIDGLTILALLDEIDALRGAMAADDERLRLAAESVGIVSACEADEMTKTRLDRLEQRAESVTVDTIAAALEAAAQDWLTRPALYELDAEQFLRVRASRLRESGRILPPSDDDVEVFNRIYSAQEGTTCS